METMKNVIVFAVFVLGMGGLIFWLWSDKESSGQEAPVIKTETTTKERPVEKDPALSEVEISVDENGLVIDRLYGKQLDLLVTRNEVKDVAVLEGIMTYSEFENNAWNFKALNLEQYIDAYLK